MEQGDPVEPVAGLPLMDMAAQRIRVVAADGVKQARETGDMVFHLLFAGVLEAQEFDLNFADVPRLIGKLQADQPHVVFEDADEGAEAFVAAVPREFVGDGGEPEGQRDVAVGEDAHALEGQGELAVQTAFHASGAVQVALAPCDQEAQRAFHADDAARTPFAEPFADGLGNGGAVVERHIRRSEPCERMCEAARRGVPGDKAREPVPHGIRKAGAGPCVRAAGPDNEPCAEKRLKERGDGLLRFSSQYGEFLRQERASGGVQGCDEHGLGAVQRTGHGYLQGPGKGSRLRRGTCGTAEVPVSVNGCAIESR